MISISFKLIFYLFKALRIDIEIDQIKYFLQKNI